MGPEMETGPRPRVPVTLSDEDIGMFCDIGAEIHSGARPVVPAADSESARINIFRPAATEV